jgi:hypothetical protein
MSWSRFTERTTERSWKHDTVIYEIFVQFYLCNLRFELILSKRIILLFLEETNEKYLFTNVDR